MAWSDASRFSYSAHGEVFRWSARYETGFAEIDAQHRRFVAQINRLGLLRVRGGHAADVDALISFLTEYTTSHVDREETLMQAAGVSEEHLAAHCRAHQAFPDQVRKLLADAGEDVPRTIDSLLPYLIEWAVVHLLDADLRMAAEIRALSAGAAAARGEAAAHAEQGNGMLLEALDELYRQLGAAYARLAAAEDKLRSSSAA